MSRLAPAHKRHTRPTTSALAQLARAQRTRDAKSAPLQLATPPTTPEPPPDGSVRLSMPRELPRPMLRPVSSDALAAIDPELASIPVEFIRRSVLGMSKRICDAMATVVPKTLPTSPLPRTLECVARDPSVELGDMPTHFLIVYDPRAGKQRGLLFPAHSLVLATQCSSLVRFSPTTRQLADDNTLTVPLIGLGVPAPNAFSILNAFLYTHNPQQLIAALLPLPGAALASISHESAGVASRLSRTMADWLSMRALLGALKVLHGVWANATSLGVNDDRLWTIIRFAWTVLIGAVERSAGVAPPNVYTDDEEADLVDQALGDAPPPYEA
ncbi:Clp1-like protein [Ceratobasidium sp. AG-Ba]|nr:Clp1-like protein [Ceratobasidium sp. AG-Ba]